MKLILYFFPDDNEEVNKVLQTFTDEGYAPLVDAKNRGNWAWLESNFKQHKMFFLIQDGKWLLSNDLKEGDIWPHLIVTVNEGEECPDWATVYEWVSGGPAGQWLKPVGGESLSKNTDISSKFYEEELLGDHYGYREHLHEEQDVMLHEVVKPFTDRPYVSVTRGWKEKGMSEFWSSLFICDSWGLGADISFLHQLWKHKGNIEDMPLEQMVKERVDRCQGLEREPEVYRRTLEEVQELFQSRHGFKRKGEEMESVKFKQ